jgi:hypothetical protein
VSKPIVITVSGAMGAKEYFFIQAHGPDGKPRTTARGEPIYALPGGGFATENAILDHLQARRGYRPRARRME